MSETKKKENWPEGWPKWGICPTCLQVHPLMPNDQFIGDFVGGKRIRYSPAGPVSMADHENSREKCSGSRGAIMAGIHNESMVLRSKNMMKIALVPRHNLRASQIRTAMNVIGYRDRLNTYAK